MYKRAWRTCKVVVLLIKPFVLFCFCFCFLTFLLPSASLDLKKSLISHIHGPDYLGAWNRLRFYQNSWLLLTGLSTMLFCRLSAVHVQLMSCNCVDISKHLPKLVKMSWLKSRSETEKYFEWTIIVPEIKNQRERIREPRSTTQVCHNFQQRQR